MYDFHNVELKSRLESVKQELEDIQKRKESIINYFNSEVCPIKVDDLDALVEFANPTSNPEKYFNLKCIQYKELNNLYKNKKEPGPVPCTAG